MVEVPRDVMAFLHDAIGLNSERLGINILDAAACAQYTNDLRRISVSDGLGLFALDDANDSNPYCIITKGVAAGMVVHFSHDPEPRIKFTSLEAFRSFLIRLRDKGEDLRTADVPCPAHPDQVALAACLKDLAAQPMDDDTESLTRLYLPLLRGDAADVLGCLMSSESFFVRESIANVIGEARLANCRDLLVKLRSDKHPQVRDAASRALRVRSI